MKRLYRLRQMADAAPVVREQLELEKEIERAEQEGDMGRAAYLKNKLKKAVKAAEKARL